MQCLRPYKIWFDPDGKPCKFKSQYLFDDRYKSLNVGCGKCLPCRINYTREWTQRLLHEQMFSSSAYFVTFTYDEENVPFSENGNMSVCKEDVQKFFKRLRKKFPDSNIRYFLRSEYGELGRPHYHAAIFNLPVEALAPSKFLVNPSKSDLWHFHDGSNHMVNRVLSDVWKLGFVELDPLLRERAEYITKYFINRQDVDPLLTPNFALMSRNGALGAQRIPEIKEKVRYYNLRCLLTDRGTYSKIPRVYRSKIYTDEERHNILLHTLEHQNYTSSLPVDDKRVEDNIRRSITFKGKKQKIQ